MDEKGTLVACSFELICDCRSYSAFEGLHIFGSQTQQIVALGCTLDHIVNDIGICLAIRSNGFNGIALAMILASCFRTGSLPKFR